MTGPPDPTAAARAGRPGTDAGPRPAGGSAPAGAGDPAPSGVAGGDVPSAGGADPATAPADGDGAPDRLGWWYLLVTASLVAVGVGAGDLFFLADGSLSVPWALAFDACERAYGATVANPVPPGFTDCLAGPARERGLVLLGAVGVVLVCAAVLLVSAPAVDRWRLRRHRGRYTVAGAADRFAALCAAAGLTGRDRPRLLIAGPPVRQAFTIGVVGGRPTVVLPVGVAVAYRNPARFDPVVRHELAHVRARDVVRVGVVRGLVWLPVPAVAVGGLLKVGSLSEVGGPGPDAVVVAGAFLRALLLAVLVAVLAAALLRAREREADRYAARAGQAEALTALLRSGTAGPAPVGNRIRAALSGPLARHPSPPARIRSLREPAHRHTGDLTQGVAVGTVTAATMVAAYDLVREWHYPALGWLPAVVAVGVGAGLLVGGLLPSLLRRAHSAGRAGRTAGWWRLVTGTAAGLFVVAFGTTWLPLPGGTGLFPGHGPGAGLLFAVVTAALGAGAVGLCVLVATALVDGQRSPNPPGPGWRSAGHATALGVTVAVLWPVPWLPQVWPDPAVVRIWLAYDLPRTGWLLLALGLPVLLALRRLPVVVPRPGVGAAVVRRVVRSTRARVVAVVVLVCGGGAALQLRLAPPGTLDEAVRDAQARWLLTALAGWVVLLVTSAGPGRRRLDRAVLAAVAATVGSALVQFLDAAVGGRSADALAFRLTVGRPLVWLLYLVALSVPVLLLRPPGRVRPRRWALPGRAVLPAVALATVALTVLVLGPGASGSYLSLPTASHPVAGPPDATRSTPPAATPSAVDPPGPTPVGGPTTPGALPAGGRRLALAEARAAVRAVRPALPPSWVSQQVTPGGNARIAPAACVPLARDTYLDVLRPGARSRAEARYGTPPGRVGIVSTTLDVTVTSYAEPVPGAVFAAADAARAACRRFTAGSPPVRFTVGGRPPPVLGEQSWRVDYALSSGSGRNRITGATVLVLVRVGHNLVTVVVTTVMRPLDERIVTGAVTAVVRALDRP
ncbi:M48 family metalloprotease [Micromonospora sp. NPDC092111]|uniref:M48 family metalloprotease n=1 Tax=Micromonospora sp. NPDC092111 TaxID=3364289 RepID=UPI0038190198